MATMDYTATATITAAASLASLANGTSWVTTAVSNATNKFLDVHVWAKLKASASASVGAVVNLRVFSGNELAVDSVSASASVSNDYVRNVPTIGIMRLGTSATGSATSVIGPLSVARAFGGFMPQEWAVVVENVSGVSLQSSADQHSIIYQGLKVV